MSNFFWENTKYNSMLARAKTKPKHKGMLRIVGPKQVLDELSKYGINTSERTLQRYAKEGLIPEPERRSAGRGKGKISDYPEDTPAHFYASWRTINGFRKLNKEDIAKIRQIILITNDIEKIKNTPVQDDNYDDRKRLNEKLGVLVSLYKSFPDEKIGYIDVVGACWILAKKSYSKEAESRISIGDLTHFENIETAGDFINMLSKVLNRPVSDLEWEIYGKVDREEDF